MTVNIKREKLNTIQMIEKWAVTGNNFVCVNAPDEPLIGEIVGTVGGMQGLRNMNNKTLYPVIKPLDTYWEECIEYYTFEEAFDLMVREFLRFECLSNGKIYCVKGVDNFVMFEYKSEGTPIISIPTITYDMVKSPWVKK